MSKNCAISQRMKANYEERVRTYLTRRTPVIIRLDGKAFHTYTKGLQKPFDEGLIEDMNQTAMYLCKEIMGAKCAYVQSDEISILVTDFDNLETQAWFDYSVQKMTSVSASLATGKFNLLRVNRELNLIGKMDYIDSDFKIAFFDSRVFNIPKEEVANYFLARQKDAVKNSIASLAQSLYPHKELENKNQNTLQEMSFQKGYNWNDLPYGQKRGRFIVKNLYVNDMFVDGDKIKQIEDEFYQKEIAVSPSWHYISNPKVRSKWELVETPLIFTEENFKQWL
jgi:tRNA(His) guanylyltransferase